MLFTQTDLPAPVAPAISRWGVLTRSIICGSPSMSFPKITGTFIFAKTSKSFSIISLKLTIALSLFGTSIPTACFPGIGATIRTLLAASLKAILSCNATILLSLTPGAGKISNIVTTGPFLISIMSASILNSLKVFFNWIAACFVSSSITQYGLSSYLHKIFSTGILYAPFILFTESFSEFSTGKAGFSLIFCDAVAEPSVSATISEFPATVSSLTGSLLTAASSTTSSTVSSSNSGSLQSTATVSTLNSSDSESSSSTGTSRFSPLSAVLSATAEQESEFASSLSKTVSSFSEFPAAS